MPFDMPMINIVWNRPLKDLVQFNKIPEIPKLSEFKMVKDSHGPVFSNLRSDLGKTKTFQTHRDEIISKYGLISSMQLIVKDRKQQQVKGIPLSMLFLDKIVGYFCNKEVQTNMRQMADIIKEPTKMKVSIVAHYAVQFEFIRAALGYERGEFIKEIQASHRWFSSGGQTNSDFYKSDNGRFIGKCVSEQEFENFQQKNALNYFKYIFSTVASNKESFLSKVLGLYEIKVNKEERKYMILMEGLTYGLSGADNIKVYDLKGSKMNRFRKTSLKSSTSFDTNYMLDRNGDPIVLQMPQGLDFFEIIDRDVSFLKEKDIVDYSLLAAVDQNNMIVKVGIIDYLIKYDWKKKMEHQLKKIKNFGLDPTIVNPSQYADRFVEFMRRCFIVRHHKSVPQNK